MKVLQEVKAVGIPAVWLQPGSFDGEGLESALKEWEGRAVGEFGERALRGAKRGKGRGSYK
jgi:hypothetical protein